MFKLLNANRISCHLVVQLNRQQVVLNFTLNCCLYSTVTENLHPAAVYVTVTSRIVTYCTATLVTACYTRPVGLGLYYH